MLSVGRLEVAGALPLGPIQISVADLLWFLVGVAAMVAVAFFWDQPGHSHWQTSGSRRHSRRVG